MPDSKSTYHPDEITLDEYLDRELTSGEMQKIEAHLEGCRECRIHVEERQVFFALINEAEQLSISRDISLEVLETLQRARWRLLTGVLSLELTLAAVLLILFGPMLISRLATILGRITLTESLFWLGENIVQLGDQVRTGLAAIGEAVELASPSGFVLAPALQFSWFQWAGILGGLFFLWVLINRILIGGTELHRSRVS
jgi:predicted anti-sigma-YlaC factor YlaD